MTDLANQPVRLPGRSQPATDGALPAERPDGSYVKLTRTTRDGRRAVSIMVREDNPAQPGDPRRWRAVEGNSNWSSWPDLHAAGRVEPLYSHAELSAAAAGAAPTPAFAAGAMAPTRPHDQPRPPERVEATISTPDMTTRGERSVGSASAAHRASRPDPQLAPAAVPTHAPGPPATTPGRAAHTAARAAPAATQPGKAATPPAPACGIARVGHRPAARR